MSSLPGTSQELAEIFGTSDDEDEDFPFNLNSYLTVGKELGDIGLPDSEPKRFDTSLLGGTDSVLFLSSIQESLGPSMEQLPESGGTPEVKPSPRKEIGNGTSNGSSVEEMERLSHQMKRAEHQVSCMLSKSA